MKFIGKKVLVTGASRGIGSAIAKDFAAAGASVAVHYLRDSIAAKQTLSRMAGEGHQLFQANLSDPEQTRKLVESVISFMGSIDILINNAGIYEEHYLPDVSYEEWQSTWQRTLAINLFVRPI